MFRKVTHSLLLAIFAGISLLGSAGLHQLLGAAHHGHSHHLVQANEVTASQTATAHQHAECKHHHHRAETPATPAHQHGHPTPAHDHDCPVCDWFAQSFFAELPASTLLVFEALEVRPLALEVVVTQRLEGVPPVRGPPSLVS